MRRGWGKKKRIREKEIYKVTRRGRLQRMGKVVGRKEGTETDEDRANPTTIKIDNKTLL